ncbi:lanthionine synthetase [Rubrivivax gelatinosus]|nr:lanthionine synthetase [Rubrivivax gelatinosus]
MQNLDPARHEPLAATWNEAAARAAVRRIAAETLASADAAGWPVHPQDDPKAPGEHRHRLYDGAGGVIWALRHLAHEGAIAAVPAFDTLLDGIVERNAAGLAAADRGSFFMGDTGLELLRWQARREPAALDRLQALLTAQLEHPSLEPLWSFPGSGVAVVHLAEQQGDARWRDLVEAALRRLQQTLITDPESGTPVWEQDLYGRRTRWLGAGHGLAGNVYLALRARRLVAPELVAPLLDAAYTTLGATALRGEGGAWNWHPMIDAARVAGRLPLVQDCHGAAGILARLADAPRTPAWDELLLAAGELTWRAGPLNKGPGVCHGTAGNALALLKLWQRCGDALWLDRARALVAHALAQVETARRHHGHGRPSLWTGDLGVACVAWDALAGRARLPLLDVF